MHQNAENLMELAHEKLTQRKRKKKKKNIKEISSTLQYNIMDT